MSTKKGIQPTNPIKLIDVNILFLGPNCKLKIAFLHIFLLLYAPMKSLEY